MISSSRGIRGPNRESHSRSAHTTPNIVKIRLELCMHCTTHRQQTYRVPGTTNKKKAVPNPKLNGRLSKIASAKKE